MSKKITIIGSGPGGYIAAIRSAQLGAEVLLIECDKIGGTCLNKGCIPTKVLLRSAERYEEIRKDASEGIFDTAPGINWRNLISHKERIVSHLSTGVESLLRANRINIIRGTASFLSETKLLVESKGREPQKLDSPCSIISTGSMVAKPAIPGLELPGVIDSDDILNMQSLPKSIVILGGGVVGVEFASLLTTFGVKVTIIELLPRILPNVDKEIVDILVRLLRSKGIKILLSSRVIGITEHNDNLVISIDGNDKLKILTEKIMICTGRKPRISELTLKNTRIVEKNGRIAIDSKMRTNTSGIYAIGDCSSPIMLAHVASEEGLVAAENAMGNEISMTYDVIPSCVYTTPEIGSVGLTEEEALQRGLSIHIGKFPIMANGKAFLSGFSQGMIKLVSDKKTHEIYGAHIISPRATDLIAELTLAMQNELTTDEIASTIHAHPTMSEIVREAALDVSEKAMHIPPRKI